MPDGNIKSEHPHPGLLQSSNIWFNACDTNTIIDNPFNGSLHFTICHGTEDRKNIHTRSTMVYDKVNDYFKVSHLSTDKSSTNTCHNSSCLFLPVEADVVGVDDYHDSQFYLIIKPTHFNDKKTMLVDRILGKAVYGRVHMVQQPKNWDVYGKHGNTLLKIHLEK